MDSESWTGIDSGPAGQPALRAIDSRRSASCTEMRNPTVLGHGLRPLDGAMFDFQHEPMLLLEACELAGSTVVMNHR